jgi:hypothetical protein
MDDVEALHVDACATRVEVVFQGGYLMRIVIRGFVLVRETAIKSTTGETSTEYVVACVAVAVVVFATYLSLFKT